MYSSQLCLSISRMVSYTARTHPSGQRSQVGRSQRRFHRTRKACRSWGRKPCRNQLFPGSQHMGHYMCRRCTADSKLAVGCCRSHACRTQGTFPFLSHCKGRQGRSQYRRTCLHLCKLRTMSHTWYTDSLHLRPVCNQVGSWAGTPLSLCPHCKRNTCSQTRNRSSNSGSFHGHSQRTLGTGRCISAWEPSRRAGSQ